MTRKDITALLVSPLILLLCACQPDTPEQHAGSSTAASGLPAAGQVPVSPPAAQSAPAASSVEADGRALAQKSGCFTCHTIEKKLVGPAWNDVAVKYRGQKDAEAKLVTKVAKGGGGVWGTVPMPPNAPRVNDNDIRLLVRFILSLK